VPTGRLTRDQRNLLLLAGAMLLASFALVGFLLLRASTSDTAGPRDLEEGPVEFGSAAQIANAIRGDGPRCFNDLAGGTKPVCLALLDDHLVALRALVPGPTVCPVSVDRGSRLLVDCRGAAVDGHDLEQFPVIIAAGKPDTLSVDLSQVRVASGASVAPGAAPSATSTTGTG
jgi:hypothetical protein